MIDFINTVVAIATLMIACISFGLQLASYINTSKNDRQSSKQSDR